jgi:hypothetical protein
MNCREFENNIDSLARGALTDSRTFDEATAHEESCANGAAQFADERALTSALRALASSMKKEEAPARVEAKLVAAFRASAARGVAVAEDESEDGRASNVMNMAARANVKSWSWAKSLAVASLAAAAAVALFMLAPQFMPSKKTNAVAGTQTGRPQSSAAQGTDANPTSTSGDRQIASSPDADVPQQSPTDRDEDTTPRVSSPRRSTNPVRPTNVSFRSSESGISQPVHEAAGEQGVAEIATEFIPLMQGGQLGQAEGGHLVRVELPRSAMASFGLPVNYERTGGRVKADVLLGDDGIARAIRFVH